jgi:HEPN domain-containing protein
VSLDEADRWLEAAHDDLAFSRYAAAGEFWAQACFHAQQAAEKAVKSLHFAGGARAVLGHNVRALIERLDGAPPDLAAQLDGARELDLLYLPTRYPNGLVAGTSRSAFSASQAARAIEIAARIVEVVERQLSR